MKLTHSNIAGAAFFSLMLVTSNVAIAQDAVRESSTTTSTTTSAGTISEFSPDMITIRSETSSEPVHYSYSKTTTYVDEAGSPVSLELVKSGLPVTVYYVKEGDRMVASKVIVRKTKIKSSAPAIEEKKTSTTTTTTDK
jgi:hypothetical protein